MVRKTRSTAIVFPAILLIILHAHAQQPHIRDSLLCKVQLPRVVSLFCGNAMSPDSLQALFKTDSLIHDTTKDISIWNLWYGWSKGKDARTCWELHVSEQGDSAMVIVGPPRRTNLAALRKKLSPWEIAEVGAIKDFHSNYRWIVSRGRPIVATLVYKNQVAQIAVVFPAVKEMCK
jgi:hypothetical protein